MKPVFELNHWYMRKNSLFKLWGFSRMHDLGKSWYIFELYLCRIGIEIGEWDFSELEKKIDNYFTNVTNEQLKKDLEEAGYENM